MPVTRDLSYLKEKNKKPIVAIWGIGFNDRHQRQEKEYLNKCLELILYLKRKGMSVLIGVPTYWRTFGFDTVKDKFLHTLIKQADIIHPWNVGRYKRKDLPLMLNNTKGD